MAKSPVVILYGSNGVALAVQDGDAIPTDTPGLLIAGNDGTNSVFVRVASDGTVRVDPTGTTAQPVTDNGGSLTIDSGQLPSALVGGRLDINTGAWLGSTAPTVGQKTMASSLPVALASDQSTITITGTVTADIGTTNGLALDATLAAQAMADNAGFIDGTTKVVPAGFIFDEVTGTALTENDGAAARIDDKRAQIHVIEDEATRGRRLTITAANAAKVDGSAVTQPISAASLPLPTGAATETTLAGVLTTSAFQARVNTLGQKTMANSTPVVLASDQTVIPVSDNSDSLTIDSPQLPSSLVGGRLDANVGAWIGSTAPSVGQKAMASSLPVAIASDQSNVPTNLTQVGGSAVVTGGVSGSQGVGGLAAAGASPSGNPVLVAGWDNTNVRQVLTDTSGRVIVRPWELATYVARADAQTLGNVKSMISLLNADASLLVRIQEIWMYNAQTGAVTGVEATFGVRRFTGHSGGTVVTPLPHDTADALDPDITTRTGATISGAGVTLRRRIFSTDDWGAGTLDTESMDNGFMTHFPIYIAKSPAKPLLLRSSEGIDVVCETNTTAGTWTFEVIFTVE